MNVYMYACTYVCTYTYMCVYTYFLCTHAYTQLIIIRRPLWSKASRVFTLISKNPEIFDTWGFLGPRLVPAQPGTTPGPDTSCSRMIYSCRSAWRTAHVCRQAPDASEGTSLGTVEGGHPHPKPERNHREDSLHGMNSCSVVSVGASRLVRRSLSKI